MENKPVRVCLSIFGLMKLSSGGTDNDLPQRQAHFIDINSVFGV